MEGVQIFSHASREESWILRYDRDVAPNIMKAQLLDVDTINVDYTWWLSETEEGSEHGRLPSTCPTHNANLKASKQS